MNADSVWGATLLTLLGVMALATPTPGFQAEVKENNGSPMVFVDGKPVSPLTFFGWAGGSGPVAKEIGTEWKEYYYTFTAPETTDGDSGIHFRVGGAGPGTVWVDDVKLYPGEKADNPPENWVRQGDWEGTGEEISRHWTLFQAQYAGADASWEPDVTTKVSGKQSLRIDIRNAGENTMHLHFYQAKHSVEKGKQYTYSLWMKADRPRNIDFMALHIDGPWTIYGGKSSVYQEQVRLARDAGLHTYSFGIEMPWPEPGKEPDFSATDAAIQTTLDEDPNALLLPRFGMEPPGWWYEAHPDDAMLFDDGRTEGVCMASEVWREEMQTHLRALVRHCEKQFGDHMLGYHPCGQHTGEWFYRRSWEPRLSDFSPAMDRGFSKWLAVKYGTPEALRKAWDDPEVSFETVRVPASEEQLRADIGLFRDPARQRNSIDYFEYKQVAMVEPLELMARVIKEETNRRKLTCLFYGYLFDMHGIPLGPQNSGHLAMKRMIQCPDVDILCSPISYLDRELGGAGCFMSAVDSVRTGGKLWLNEDDTRTYLTPADSGFGRVDFAEGTYWVLQRNFAQLWPRRLACWWMDLGNAGWFSGKDIWDRLAPLQAFYEQHLDEPATWSPEVALIVDEVSPIYTKCDRSIHSPLVYQMRSAFFRMGTPFGIYLLSDLVEGKVPPMKAYFMANCFRLDAAQREAVQTATRGKTVTWFYGGGFLSDKADDGNIGDALGIDVRRGTPRPSTITPAAAAGDLGELNDGLTEPYGNGAALDPVWTLADPDARVLGAYPDGQAAVFAKQTGAGLRVYVGALSCPPRLLRNIARAAGVQIWLYSDDIVLTDGVFLAVSATSAGRKRIQLPGPCTVMDLVAGTEIVRDTDTLTLDLRLGETRLLLLK